MEWARGAVFNQAVAPNTVFSINLLSGFEADVAYDFRGTVRGIMQSWMEVTAGGVSPVNCTLAIGVFPDVTPILTTQLTTTLKEYPWTYYRRVMSLSAATASDTVQYGALSFDTNTRSARKLQQKGQAYQLFVDNIGATTLNFCHWSNILLAS